jgi:hypothetical protein
LLQERQTDREFPVDVTGADNGRNLIRLLRQMERVTETHLANPKSERRGALPNGLMNLSCFSSGGAGSNQFQAHRLLY